MVDFVTQNEISFVTTSAGDPSALAPQLKDWASRCSTSCRRSGAPRRRSPQGSTVWLSKVRKAEGSRMPTVHRPCAGARDRQAFRRADHRRRRHCRRPLDGGGPGHGGRWRPDGHPHGGVRRVADPRQLETVDRERVRGRHGHGQPPSPPAMRVLPRTRPRRSRRQTSRLPSTSTP